MKNKRLKNASFEMWLRRTGGLEVGRLLDINPSNVSHWLAGKALPHAKLMKRIKELTNGKIGYAEIIEGNCSPLTK